MKISAVLILSVALIFITFAPRSTVQSSAQLPGGQTSRSYAPGEVLVQLKEAPADFETPEVIADQILPTHAAGTRAVPDAGRSSLYLMKIASNTTVERAIAEAEKNPRVEFAEPNYYVHPADTVPNDALFNQEWDMLNTGMETFGGKAGADIEATKAWDITTGSDDVVVAVTDTGIDFSNPDLAPNVWVNPNAGKDGFTGDINGWNFANNNAQLFDPTSDQGHGTHVSGTIGAVGNNGIGVAGVAWHVKLMGLKFIGLQKNGQYQGTTGAAVGAINYAIMQKSLGVNVRAINASWDGGQPSRSLRKAIIRAGNAGILFVCAAGNADAGFGSDMDDPNFAVYPGAWNDIPTLISVAATDNSDGIASFSNFGHATVSVGAPGVHVMSTFPNGQYTLLDGTSMATPHVTGVAALLAATEPALGPADVKQRIISTAVPLISLAAKVQGSARLDAFNALTNHTSQPGSPQISGVTTSKKFVTVDGLNFVNGSSVILVNGSPLPKMRYDSTYIIGNGTLTRLISKVGKDGINSVFPSGVSVQVTVMNPTTGQTSAPVNFVR
ncbi:MAG TPA: S8 family peptidase [Blastocatellia bacterium]|nr:S8 family peptidase [Blastocatellia bacterium]